MLALATTTALSYHLSRTTSPRRASPRMVATATTAARPPEGECARIANAAAATATISIVVVVVVVAVVG